MTATEVEPTLDSLGARPSFDLKTLLILLTFLMAGVAAAGSFETSRRSGQADDSAGQATHRTGNQPSETQDSAASIGQATPALRPLRLIALSLKQSAYAESPKLGEVGSYDGQVAPSVVHPGLAARSLPWHFVSWTSQDEPQSSATAERLNGPWLGFVTPLRRAQVPARDSGVLVDVAIEPGQRVSAGDRLGTLDRTRQLMAIELATAELELAQARVEHRAARELAVLDALQQETAFIEGTGSGSTTELQQQEAQLRRLLLSPRRQEIEQERLEQLEREFKLQQVLKQIELRSAQAEIERGEIRAPWNGVVTQQFRQQGEWVVAGDAICELVSLETLKIDLPLPVAAATADLVGRACQVRVTGRGGDRHEFVGTVARVGDLVDANQEVRIEIRFENRIQENAWLAVPGSPAEIEFTP